MITNVNGVLDTLKVVTLFQYIEQNQTIFIKSRLLILEWISNVLLQVTCVVVSVALFVALFADYMIFYIMGRHCWMGPGAIGRCSCWLACWLPSKIKMAPPQLPPPTYHLQCSRTLLAIVRAKFMERVLLTHLLHLGLGVSETKNIDRKKTRTSTRSRCWPWRYQRGTHIALIAPLSYYHC
jgi:hypothetical protein